MNVKVTPQQANAGGGGGVHIELYPFWTSALEVVECENKCRQFKEDQLPIEFNRGFSSSL